jgi:prolipoprotein diacylglyceryltransferase
VLPFFSPLATSVAGVRIDAFAVLGACALIVAVELAARRAPPFGIDEHSMRAFSIWVLVPALVGAHLCDALIDHFDAVALSPSLLVNPFAGVSLCGGILGALIGALAWRQTVSEPITPFTDVLLSSAPIPWAIARVGSVLAHAHPGARTGSDNPLAVAYPSGPHWDIGVLDLLAALVVFAGLAALGRRSWPVGTYTAFVMLAYAALRFAIESVDDPPRAGLLGVTQGRVACVLMIVLGLVALSTVRHGTEPAWVRTRATPSVPPPSR